MSDPSPSEIDEVEFVRRWIGDLNRGILQFVVLLTVKTLAPCHGYRIAREIEDRFAGSIRVHGGTIYPLLNRLEKRGLLDSVTASDGGRVKTLYTLTQKGVRTFEMMEDVWRPYVEAIQASLLDAHMNE